MSLSHPARKAGASVGGPWPAGFAAAFGIFLGLALIKFGNPVILDRLVLPPRQPVEVLFSPWPVAWGYVLLICVAIAGIGAVGPRSHVPRIFVMLPLIWLGWQWICAAGTVDARLSRPTVIHFSACVACFYLGLFALGRVGRLTAFWVSLTAALGWVLLTGFDQHYGGLEATRRVFYEDPNWRALPPEYLKRISSDRIFATLFYPNALAGVVLLLLPVLVVVNWHLLSRRASVLRGVAVGCLGYAGLACLYWSGSKSGWLIAAILLAVIILRLPIRPNVRFFFVVACLVLATAGFAVRFRSYFARGATSASARFDYWRAACQTIADHPLRGTGPGTFSVPYKRLKRPESEMTRLVHNDYLEQASDSGIPGFLGYSGLVLGSLYRLYRKSQSDPVRFAVWLGLLGWAIQSFFEFGLYIPALAWLSFALLGWLWGTNNELDRNPPGD